MNSNNLPLTNDKNTPQALEAQYYGHRSYTNSKLIIDIAIDEYKKHNGKGITYMTLLEKGIAKSKKQAQGILKWHLKQVTLFTIPDKRPQEYYPSCLRSEILKYQLQKNTPVDPLGVSLLITTSSSSSPSGVIRSK